MNSANVAGVIQMTALCVIGACVIEAWYWGKNV